MVLLIVANFYVKLFEDSSIPISTEWKNEKFSLTEKKIREINSLVTSLVKTLLSRKFYQKSVRENFRNFHTVASGRHGILISHFLLKNFVKPTFSLKLKKPNCKLISRIIGQVTVYCGEAL